VAGSSGLDDDILEDGLVNGNEGTTVGWGVESGDVEEATLSIQAGTLEAVAAGTGTGVGAGAGVVEETALAVQAGTLDVISFLVCSPCSCSANIFIQAGRSLYGEIEGILAMDVASSLDVLVFGNLLLGDVERIGVDGETKLIFVSDGERNGVDGEKTLGLIVEGDGKG